LITGATYFSTKKISRTIFAFLMTYTAFFIMSSAPSLIVYAIDSSHLQANAAIVASKIASPTSFLNNEITQIFNAINIKMTLIYTVAFVTLLLALAHTFYRTISISLWRNIRPIQSLYHIGLLVVGMSVAVTFRHTFIPIHFFSILAFFILCCGIIAAWYSTVIFNDIIDIDIDRISNPQRPLITQVIDVETYRDIGYLLFVISLIFVAMINAPAATILMGYHAISFLYNTPPLRLKRFPLIATLLAAIASFFIVVIGYVTVTSSHSLAGFPPQIAILLIIAYTVSLPIKDLKDIAGDAQNHVYTIPVLCGEKYGRLIIGIGVFGSFILSVITLNNWALFWPALCAGSLCFWSIVGHNTKGFVFGPHAVLRVVFVIVVIYGAILGSSLLM
jgi:4-hydroxybenzoate polyprenyltransferase